MYQINDTWNSNGPHYCSGMGHGVLEKAPMPPIFINLSTALYCLNRMRELPTYATDHQGDVLMASSNVRSRDNFSKRLLMHAQPPSNSSRSASVIDGVVWSIFSLKLWGKYQPVKEVLWEYFIKEEVSKDSLKLCKNRLYILLISKSRMILFTIIQLAQNFITTYLLYISEHLVLRRLCTWSLG